VGDLRGFKAVIPQTTPLGFSNDFMMSSVRNPFFLFLINRLNTSDHWWLGSKYMRVLTSTGSVFLTNGYLAYPDKELIHVFPLECYAGARSCFLGHVAGSSWHDGDATIFIFLGKIYESYFPEMIFFCATLTLVITSFSFIYLRFRDLKAKGLTRRNSHKDEGVT